MPGNKKTLKTDIFLNLMISDLEEFSSFPTQGGMKALTDFLKCQSSKYTSNVLPGREHTVMEGVFNADLS